MTQTKKRILSIVLAAVLLAAGLWYIRPRPLADFLGEDITGMAVSVVRLSDNVMTIGEIRQGSFLPGEEHHQAVSDLLGNLRFRRTIFRDAAYQVNELLGKNGMKEIHEGDYNSYLAFYTVEEMDFITDLRFWVDEWTIRYGDSSHVLTLVGGQDAAIALHDALWELLPEETP